MSTVRIDIIGKLIVSSVFGIAIVSFPAGAITAGYMDEINNRNDDEEIKKE